MPTYLLSVEKADVDIDTFKILPNLDNRYYNITSFQLFS